MAALFDKPCILVGGAPRSGTTLVGSVLGSHPRAAMLLEDRLTDVARAVQRLASVRVEAEDGDRAALFGVGRSFLTNPDAEAWPALERLSALPGYRARFSRLLTAVFESCSGRSDPAVVGAKLPIRSGWEDLETLSAVFADLRLVFVLRRPFDVVASSLRRRDRAAAGLDVWPITTVEGAINEWQAAMRLMARAARAPRLPVLLVRYEDLCADPGGEMSHLLAFAGLDDAGDRPGITRAPSAHPLASLSTVERGVIEESLGAAEAAWTDLTPDALLRRFGDGAPRLPFGRRCSLADEDCAAMLDGGFSGAEPWGRWTDGPRARLRLRHDPPQGDLRLTLEVAMAWAPDGSGRAPARLIVNGGSPRPLTLRPGARAEATLPRSALDPDGLLELELELLRPKSAREPPVDDARALGIGLSAFSLDQA